MAVAEPDSVFDGFYDRHAVQLDEVDVIWRVCGAV